MPLDPARFRPDGRVAKRVRAESTLTAGPRERIPGQSRNARGNFAAACERSGSLRTVTQAGAIRSPEAREGRSSGSSRTVLAAGLRRLATRRSAGKAGDAPRRLASIGTNHRTELRSRPSVVSGQPRPTHGSVTFPFEADRALDD